MPSKFRSKIGGQGLMEYMLITVAVALVLFLPFDGGPSPSEQLAFAFRNFFRGFSFFVSVL
ncbi:hypothetical protein CAter282_2883 [Collimonas arenae]|uniref:Uncharacterized protein n=1 Tax=Collimonas arenae TaxID=279058 RepID=A0A127QKM1_9BURK|nr:hypothetical protein [Collimonas arenae]AMP00717.1 hypothetical protein CAter10_3176 [Collimonas arenae]AMP10607.1 hypothetical protein CAter282_2883 [Collimonas arenae]